MDDDGKTWSGGLMIDEREDVTCPDGVQAGAMVNGLLPQHQSE